MLSIFEGAQVEDQEDGPPTPPGGPQQPRRWPLALGFGVLGLLIGAGAVAAKDTAPTDTAEYRTLTSDKASALGELEDVKVKLKDANAHLGAKSDEALKATADVTASNLRIARLHGTLAQLRRDIARREAAVKTAQDAVKAGEKNLTADAKAVTKREKAVGAVEADNTVTDGVYEVGVDMKAGTYKTRGAKACYYAVQRSADTSDIITNHIGDGQTTVSVSNGQYLRLDCRGAEWVLQG